MRRIVLSGAVAMVLVSNAYGESFDLGKINVLSEDTEEKVFEQTVTNENIQKDNALTVNEALDNMSGISQDLQGGRAESSLYIRGFDARRIGFFVDGVPLYVPYDGNFDYGRFTTGDIAQIDVSKGYSSVSYGANTMGGVVNVVTRKPTKEFEGFIRNQTVFDSDFAFAKQLSTISLGTLQDKYYIQYDASYANQDHFRLSDDYQATQFQPDGDRLHSENKDYNMNLKAGYFIDDTAEVALGYMSVRGEKQQPPVTDTDFSREKYWDWPKWDKDTVYLNAEKNYAQSVLRAVAYYDKFNNALNSYDDENYNSFDKKSSFLSEYDDYTYGARVSYEIEMDKHYVTVSGNYKEDVHRGYDIGKTDGVKTVIERYEDRTFSLGVEDVYSLSNKIDLLGGISYDMKDGAYVYDKYSEIQELAPGELNTFNPQAAILYKLDETSVLRGSVARKTYLTSMKDRYSRRLGFAEPNPDLESEKATNYEISYSKTMQNTQLGITGFVTEVDDAIQNIILNDNGTPNDTRDDLFQNQNVGEFQHRGIELDISYKGDTYEVGGNYTYLTIKNKNDTDVKLTDVPENQLFAYVKKDLWTNTFVYANVKFRNGAYQQKMDATYLEVPSFTTFDAKINYSCTDTITTELGIKNITDEDYAYDMGFPMPGREFFVTLEYIF